MTPLETSKLVVKVQSSSINSTRSITVLNMLTLDINHPASWRGLRINLKLRTLLLMYWKIEQLLFLFRSVVDMFFVLMLCIEVMLHRIVKIYFQKIFIDINGKEGKRADVSPDDKRLTTWTTATPKASNQIKSFICVECI